MLLWKPPMWSDIKEKIIDASMTLLLVLNPVSGVCVGLRGGVTASAVNLIRCKSMSAWRSGGRGCFVATPRKISVLCKRVEVDRLKTAARYM